MDVTPAHIADEYLPLVVTEPDQQKARDAYLSINTLLAYRAEHQVDKPALGWFESLGHNNDKIHTYTYRELWARIGDYAVWLAELVAPRREEEEQLVIALTGKNSIDFLLTELAVLYLGHCPLLLSSTSTVIGATELIHKCKATLLLHDEATSQLAVDLASSTGVPLHTFPSPSSVSHTPEASPSVSAYAARQGDLLWYLHTSGSTGNPKPIAGPQWKLLRGAVHSVRTDALVFTPCSHAYFQFLMVYTIASANCLILYPSAVPLSPSSLTSALRVCREQDYNVAFASVPTVTAMLKDYADELKRCAAVVNAGGPLPRALGDNLVSQGVTIWNCMASTELGLSIFPLPFLDASKAHLWYIGRPHPVCEEHVRFEPCEDAEGLYEEVALASWPALSASNRPDGSYATGDLFKRHEDGWINMGRRDDMLVHKNGHKTNPLILEAMIAQSPLVREVIAIGADRDQVGLIVIPSKAGLRSDDLIPVLQQTNEVVPPHSCIVPGLVLVAPIDAIFPRAPKGTFKRPEILAQYATDIDAMYNAQGEAAIVPTALSSLGDAQAVVDDILSRLFPRTIKADEDFFKRGMDSITLTRITNALRRKVQMDTLPSDLLYQTGNPKRLAEALWALSSDASNGTALLAYEAAQAPTRLLADVLKSLSEQKPQQDFTRSPHILLTGATGGLGRHMLAILAQQGTAGDRKILLPVRAASPSIAIERIEKSLKQGQLPPLAKLNGVGCYPQDSVPTSTSIPVGLVIHSAWPVNFNLPLSSFEESVRDCVALLKTYPQARHVFISSISVALEQGGASGDAPEVAPESTFQYPPPQRGYAQSKWVAEHLFTEAAKLGWDTAVVRLGQVTGDSQHGIWNNTDVFPIMVRSLAALKALPDREVQGENVEWLPMDRAAKAIVRIAQSPQQGLFNLRARNSTPWKWILEWCHGEGRLGEFDVVPFSDWIEKIRQSPDPEANPLIKLLDFLVRPSKPVPELRMERFYVTQGEVVNGEQQNPLEGVDETIMLKTIEAWRKSGLLK